MPRVRRRRADVRAALDSERTRERLQSGHDFLLLDGAEASDAELRDAWEDLREEILPAFIAQHPGCRPWAWWRWDSPEPRQQVGDGPQPVADSGLWFGVPRMHRGFAPSSMYESEMAYLRRLDLLTDPERAALAAAE